MKLKLDEDGHAVLENGNPVYKHQDGKEVAFDAPGTVATITRLNGEAKTNRERAETAEKSLKMFEGISDPSAALEALKTVSNLDDKKLVDAGEVERVKSEAIKAVEEKYAPVVEANKKLENDLYAEKVGGSFSRSKYIAEECGVPADMIEAKFGQSFKVEEGAIVGYDQNGSKIFSQSRPGEVANFDEALGIMIGNYAHKDNILKGSGGSGAGLKSENGNNSGKPTISRTEFDSKEPAAQSSYMKEGGQVTD